jgi:hypothetical protein
MQAIKNNPYRTLGLLAGASTKEITRQTNRLKKHITADAELPDDYSFAKIDNFQRTVEMIDDAVERNNTDPQKIENALFWFWKGNEITDEPTFDALKEGDVENAFDIWFKLVNHKDENGSLFWTELTNKNSSAYHNIAVLKLTGRIDKWSFVSAVMANIKFIENECFAEFVKSVTDETYRTNKKDIELLFLEKITNSIAEKETKTTLSELVKYLNGYNFTAKADFIKSISKSFTDNIKTAITTCKNVRNASKTAAATAGETLYKNTKDDLAQLENILGESDFDYVNIADKVANEVLQCSIEYFNCMQNENTDENFMEKALVLFEFAKRIACGNVVKGRIADNEKTINKVKANCLCFYCNKYVADKNSAYKRTIYKETYRSPWYEPRKQVRFQKAEVTTPRCKHCKEIHESSSEWLWLGPTLVLAVIGLLLGLISWGYWFGCLLGGGTIGGIIGAVISSIDKSNKVSRANIKEESDFTKFEPISKLLREGWTTSEPTASS